MMGPMIAAPMLILLLFVAIAAIVLFIKLFSKRPWLALIAVLALLLLFVPVLYVRTVDHNVHIRHLPEVSREWRAPQSQDSTAAIWLPGIEDEFEANVYPSKLSAVRSLGLRIGQAVGRVFDTQTSPSRFVLFQGAHDHSLLDEFGEAISRTFPDTRWSIESETAAVQDDEVGIRLDFVNIHTHPAPWMRESGATSGTIQASVLSQNRHASIKADFSEKPWVEDFSSFLNAKPNRRFVIAKSTESCMTEGEANRQALENACVQLTQMLSRISRRRSGVPAPLASRVESDDILESNLVLDRFVQSFEGSAGRIWRQALLIDGSTSKLEQLAHRKVVMARAMKMNWAKMFFTVFGLIVLITIVYVFLNAATKGYYTWSLRIAGIVLAAIAIILLLS